MSIFAVKPCPTQPINRNSDQTIGRNFQRSLHSVFLSSFALLALFPMAAIAQTTGNLVTKVAQAKPVEVVAPKPNSLDNSVFSIPGGERLMAESSVAVNQQNYTLAITKLQDARQVFNQLSNFYQDLTTSFAGIDNRISDSHRQKALQTAQLRDKATYQLAVVYRANNQPELAVPLLIQLIRSQAPTRELGQQAYQQLFELGFVDMQYPRTPAATN
ncbi:hypothetical protein V2H45_00190 [Tumidithrix elongata RA019]|uniref:TPR repeat-containing protein n=2 Tax=Tumidithrix TaxID=3088355 RepID=A0AAW9PXD6_9CYAN|nr:hypothetical protein [Tumidithrix elongata RA019]